MTSTLQDILRDPLISACLPSREAATIFARLRERDSDNPLFDRNLSLEERIKLGAAYVREKAQSRADEIKRRSSLIENKAAEKAEYDALKTELQVYMEFLKAGPKHIEEIDTLEDLSKPVGPLKKVDLVERLKGTTWSEALEWLCAVGLKDKKLSVREAAAKALKGTTDSKALKALCELALKDHPVVCRAAAEALTGTADQATLRWLCELGLKDEDWGVRLAAVQVLRNTTAPKALRALCELGLNDEDEDVRRAAAKALKDNPEFEIQAALRRAGF